MTTLSTLFYFFLALMLLITIHEYGHFLVARLCGVKVLRFSFGFGKVLFSRHDKHGTEFAISVLPLGGYVKMLDENEGEVADNERPFAFNNQSVYARIAIVLAGPLFNFLFALFAFWLIAMIGVLSLAPIIGKVSPQSIAATAGLTEKDEIIAFNNTPINSWHDFQYALIPQLGSHETITLRVQSKASSKPKTVLLPLAQWHPDTDEDPLTSFGITPFVPSIPPIVGEVVPKSVAQQAGFLPKDTITAINGNPVNDWLQLVDTIRHHPGQKIVIQISRNTHSQPITVIPATQTVNGNQEGYIGLRSVQPHWPQKWVRFERHGPLSAARIAFEQTVDLTAATFTMFGRLLTGQLGLQNLSGPIGIAEGAGNSGRSGLTSYLSFLGFISISLGVLNLLPIPLLDGGHFAYYLFELIRRKPLSDRSKSVGFYMGFILIAMLMFMAIFNDFSRILR